MIFIDRTTHTTVFGVSFMRRVEKVNLKLPARLIRQSVTLFHEIVRTFFANTIGLPGHRNKIKNVGGK